MSRAPLDVERRELALLSPAVRGSAAALEQLLDPEFREVGASGRLWTRDEVIAALVAERAEGPGEIAVTELGGTVLSPELVLVTYVSERDGRRARRLSLWRRRAGSWRVLYHQATPLGGVAPGAGVPLTLSRFARRQPAVTRRLTLAHGTLMRVTRGRVAARWFGAPVLLLETTGRRTGRTRLTPLVYVRDGDDLVVVPANAGADRDPDWWLNLQVAGAGVAVIGGSRRPVTPRVVEGARRARLWDRFRDISPIDHYQRSTARRLDVVALTPAPATRIDPVPFTWRSPAVGSLVVGQGAA